MFGISRASFLLATVDLRRELDAVRIQLDAERHDSEPSRATEELASVSSAEEQLLRSERAYAQLHRARDAAFRCEAQETVLRIDRHLHKIRGRLIVARVRRDRQVPRVREAALVRRTPRQHRTRVHRRARSPGRSTDDPEPQPELSPLAGVVP